MTMKDIKTDELCKRDRLQSRHEKETSMIEHNE